eukprot:15765231-Heterocapsa_arctica.AAC.1
MEDSPSRSEQRELQAKADAKGDLQDTATTTSWYMAPEVFDQLAQEMEGQDAELGRRLTELRRRR